MTMQAFSLCAATNEDINRLPRLLVQFPEHVLVREAFGDFFRLDTLVHGPFLVTEEDGYWILVGTRLSDEKTACLRVILWGEQKVPVLQWKESLLTPWRFDANWAPVHQLYIPSVILVPKAKTA